MGIETLANEPIMLNNKEMKRVGRAVTSLLTVAAEENRITCGLRPAIQMLEMDPSQILFCVMPQTRDSAKHIQSVLLQAFCYEHNIAIIKVDSMERLREIVGAADCSCILIHKNINHILCLELELDRILHSVETGFITQPVFKLPAK
uniref:Ribosomal protein eL8/eL30/eS12/Gadd45 domain-containing protein n=1 Tax=Homalodisca liturata TaxID=320908 RepID=A0A1B6H815_9HEMI